MRDIAPNDDELKNSKTTTSVSESDVKISMKKKQEPSLLKKELNEQLRQVFGLQQERVLLLNDFEIKFKEYLLDAPNFDFENLKKICKTTTDEMNRVSAEILAIKRNFSSDCFNIATLYNLVDRLQDYEATKFKLTLSFYMLDQERLEKLAQTDEFEIEFGHRLLNIRKEITDIKLLINDCLEEMRYEMFDEDQE